ncbi:MAG: ABC transporter ATP-binding protein/permease, partial [Alphaproteobacteria bacterium]|nr:ABC transporter ATP-binding protein/permease [Alphaproteobacteria bacterium]
LIIGGGGILVLKGSLTIGSLTVGIAYLAHLMKPLAKINELASSISRGLARGERLTALLDRKPDIVDREDAVDALSFSDALTFEKVSFAYRSATGGETSDIVLRDVDLRIDAGSFVVIVGPSGAGKSTLLALLLRLFDPTNGRILLDGVPIADIRLKSLREQFAVMMQETHLFSGAIREALQPSGRPIDDQAIWAALANVSMDDFVRALPGGLDAVLAENGANLSGGQRARLSLARAILADAPILLLDEPLANVDPKSQAVILAALGRLRSNRTCIAVTHQMALAHLADQVLRIDRCGIETMQADEASFSPMRALP